MEKIRMGIIGGGMAWDRLHGPAYERLKDLFSITAICEPDREKAEQIANHLSLSHEAIYKDYHQMFRDGHFDAVDIMVPIAKNFELASEAIKYNINFIAEKPYAATVEQAKKLIAKAKNKTCKILVAENIRYTEENVIIKNLLNQNAIGRVTYFIDNHITDFYADMHRDTFAAKEWRQHPDFKGGVFLDSAVHNLALHRFLFGNVRDVYASGLPSPDDFCEYNAINALMTFDDNISGHFMYFNNGVESQHPRVGLRIFGTEGEIFLEEKMCGCVNYTLRNGESKQIYYAPDEGYYQELKNFYHALKDNEEIVSTPEKELGDIQTVFDILQSIKTNTKMQASNFYSRAKQAL